LSRSARPWPKGWWRPSSVAHVLLIAIVLGTVSVVGYATLRFAVSCVTLDSARAGIEDHVRAKQVRRLARMLKTSDRERLAARISVRVTALTCGPSLLGGMTCRARHVLNGQAVGMDAGDHYYRIGHGLLGGWQVASVRETSGLRYSLTPCRCSWGSAAREP
jgi:hypothetical protein